MKKILFFLLMALSVAAFSQGKKISDLTESSTMLPNGVLEIEQGGSSYSISKSDLQRSLRDSLKTAYTLIYELYDLINAPVVSDVVTLARYKFEETGLDETSNNNDLTLSSEFVYTDLHSDNSYYAGDFDTITKYATTPIINFTDNHIFIADIFIINDSAGDRTILSNMVSNNGFTFNVDSTRLEFKTGNGVTTSEVYSDYGVVKVDTSQYRAYRVAVNSSGEMYVNGLEVNTTGSLLTYATSGQMRIGQTLTGGSPFYGYIDNVNILSGSMDSTQYNTNWIASEYYRPVDNIAPSIVGGYMDESTIANLNFTEPLYSVDTASLKTDFAFFAADSAYTINYVESENNSIVLHVDTVPPAKTLKVSYAPGTLSDFDGNTVSAFNGFLINNNITVDSVFKADIQYLFELDNEDNIGVFDRNDTSVVFSEAIFKEGTASLRVPTSAVRAWIPASYTMPDDILTLSCWVYLSANTGNYEIWENFSATPLKVEWRAPGNDIRVYVGADYAEAQNIAGSSSATPTGAWRHLTVIINQDGYVAIYVDGTDETDDNMAAASVDWSTPIRLMGYTPGYMDDMQLYPDTLTEAEIAILQTPGEVVYEQGSGSVPQIPAGTTPFPSSGDSIWAIDFESQSLGLWAIADMVDYIEPVEYLSSSWSYSGLSTSEKPNIVSYNYPCETGTCSSKGLRVTQLAGTDAGDYTPISITKRLNDDPQNNHILMSANITFLSGGWYNNDDGLSGKLFSWIANYDTWIDTWPRADTYADQTSAKDGFNFKTSSNANFIYPAPYLWYNQYAGVAYSPNLSAPINVSSDITVNFTAEVYLGTQGGSDGWTAYYVNGECVHVMRGAANLGIDFKSVDYVVNAAMIKSHWGGQEGPTNDVQTILDDIYVWRWKPTYRAVGEAPSVGDFENIPGWDTSGGYKK